MKYLVFFVFGGFLLVFLVEVVSFDCEKVEWVDEKVICVNWVLNDKDVEMSVKYYFFCGLFVMGGCGVM